MATQIENIKSGQPHRSIKAATGGRLMFALEDLPEQRVNFPVGRGPIPAT